LPELAPVLVNDIKQSKNHEGVEQEVSSAADAEEAGNHRSVVREENRERTHEKGRKDDQAPNGLLRGTPSRFQ
jgi:hypothetical protein